MGAKGWVWVLQVDVGAAGECGMLQVGVGTAGGCGCCRCSVQTTITHLKKFLALKLFKDMHRFKDVSSQ